MYYFLWQCGSRWFKAHVLRCETTPPYAETVGGASAARVTASMAGKIALPTDGFVSGGT